MWPFKPSHPELIKIQLEMPEVVKQLAGRLNGGLDRLLEAAWLDGCYRDATWGFIAGVVVSVVVYLLWKRKGQ